VSVLAQLHRLLTLFDNASVINLFVVSATHSLQSSLPDSLQCILINSCVLSLLKGASPRLHSVSLQLGQVLI
jgi:hypothetical protein